MVCQRLLALRLRSYGFEVVSSALDGYGRCRFSLRAPKALATGEVAGFVRLVEADIETAFATSGD